MCATSAWFHIVVLKKRNRSSWLKPIILSIQEATAGGTERDFVKRKNEIKNRTVTEVQTSYVFFLVVLWFSVLFWGSRIALCSPSWSLIRCIVHVGSSPLASAPTYYHYICLFSWFQRGRSHAEGHGSE